ncbi:hypothetical protein ACFL1B_02350 [Nanoarchaeota archaeon]
MTGRKLQLKRLHPYSRLYILILAIAVLAAYAIAQPTGTDALTQQSSSRGNLTQTASSVQAQAGNVSEINIEATAITTAWQGYFGNITGSITLENSAGDVFYNWSGLGSFTGEVYAARTDSVAWATIGCVDAAEMNSETGYLGKSNSDPDSVWGTFSSKNHPEFLIGTATITANTCNSTNAYVDTGQDSARFYQVLLADGGSNIVYSTLIDQDQTGFNGIAYDFELLVGENGNASSSSTTPYYFFIELN